MITALKVIFALFMIVGAAFTWYGAKELLHTRSLLSISTGTAKATFAGYHREYHETTSTTTMPDGMMTTSTGLSVLSYPEFTYTAPDGVRHTVREPKGHIYELFKPGQEVEILLFEYFQPRLNGFFSLYARDLVILIFGLGFILVPFSFWKFALPMITQSKPALKEFERVQGFFEGMLNERVGPVSVRSLLCGIGLFFGVVLVFALGAGLAPFMPDLRFGSGGRLLNAMEEKRFDDARALLDAKADVNGSDKYNRTPLLLALEAGRPDLARLMIEAGADVNIKSKMYMTPLRVAVRAGDLETVRLLLSKGASPDTPADETPPFVYALSAKRYDIARLILEAGPDLNRVYQEGDLQYTLGDMAMLAKRADMVEMIRSRGGKFLK